MGQINPTNARNQGSFFAVYRRIVANLVDLCDIDAQERPTRHCRSGIPDCTSLIWSRSV
ncbi:hypothetical protein BAUCODRAFT_31802 [Baudoinia panamericana UAMH 10762]|uniref:Uncharacterized protein n=1 Tax=Baudoinia panamericana (strain UAMH 10762) TaxID=717646 RepID=M2N1I9_BAUPA|nr:uncharacterized protein BAUCODRAFT_31802 [Baudoinia panamericana UAMH 10762]EMC97798.1 hypothetical protein BAUCODRAFT_31802 [Baudoinia panamericana UAMH 10762]